MNPAFALDFPPADFEIMSAESNQLIGHAYYTLLQSADAMTLHGENRYLNGDYDIEDAKLTGPPEHPTMVSFRHDFFDAAGAQVIAARLDRETGLGVCGKSTAARPLDLKTEQLSLPEDTYAGASVLIPIQEFIGHDSRRDALKLHVFNCAPTPKIVAVDIKPETPQAWREYPGELEKVDVRPNFGFWTVMITPFVPKLAAWFDPSQNMLLVGAQLERYYRGPKIILVRKREAALTKAPAPSH